MLRPSGSGRQASFWKQEQWGTGLGRATVGVPRLWAKEGMVETPTRVPLTFEMEALVRLPCGARPPSPTLRFSDVLSAQFTLPGVWNVDLGS